MPSLPAEFRCFQHVNFIFARNLPLKVPSHMAPISNNSVEGKPLNNQEHEQIGYIAPSPELIRGDQCVVEKRSTSIYEVEGSRSEVLLLKGMPSCLSCSQPSEFPSYDSPRCVSSYYILREPTTSDLDGTGEVSQYNGRVCYRSEVCANTQHPTWQWIPANVLLNYATHTKFILEVYYCSQDDGIRVYTQACENSVCYNGCAGEFSSCATSSCWHPNFERDRCVYRVPLDTVRLRYVAHSIAEADQHVLDKSIKNTQDCTVFLVKCFDGVFLLSPEANVSPDKVLFGTEKAEEPWCRIDVDSDSSLGTLSHNKSISIQRDLSSRGRMPSGAPCGSISVGDLKSLSIATLAWRNLHRVILERRQELLDGIDASEVLYRVQTIQCGMEATLKASLSHFNEQLTMSILAVEQLRVQVEEKQRVLDRHEHAFSLLKDKDVKLDEAHLQKVTSDKREEYQRTELRFKLAQYRKCRALELASIYHVELGVQRANYSGNTKKLCDTINGVSLPLFTQQSTDAVSSSGNVFSQISAQEMYNESLALGYAAHVVQTLSVIYGIVLPFPLILAGARSRVLVRSDLSPELAAASCTGSGDAKLPLFYQSVVSRPLIQAAAALLACDIVTLTQAMGKDVAKVCSFGLRLGEALQYILSDKSN
ncbi:unnamed protein product [Phytomonas sp. Hart1]|nr:unnamed protein product [Phytomonas sp. Hart1]|eukprot:CCW70464.1 unnamed protein product [Phytomonas sp. isolate Hart1]